jgi:hypothetical protein
MKKLTLLIVLAWMIQATVSSQPCLPGGIIFMTQAEIDNFQTNYPGCTNIEGNVSIGNGYPTDITNLNGLNVVDTIGGYLNINSHVNLTNLTGLEALIFIGDYLLIEENESITSLTGLDALTTIGGDLTFYENQDLTGFTGLDALTSIGGKLEIGYNPSLTSLTGFEALTSTGGLSITYFHTISDLTGLNALTYVGGYIGISDCNALTSLTGLDSLTTINGFLGLHNTPALTTLSGLEGLTSVGGISFTSIPIASLTGLNALTSIAGDLMINGCDSLPTLSGLESLTSIGGELEIKNNEILTSLSGIENIDYQSITNLKITYNPSLSYCEVNSVCEYLADPGGTIWLFDNSEGCNTQAEVQTACSNSVTEILDHKSGLVIFPNPAKTKLFIRIKNNTSVDEVVIYNQIGKKVLIENKLIGSLDISKLQQGMYIIELVSSKSKIREKLIIR